MKIESHLKILKESIAVIEECVQKGIVERQRTIGFSTSAAAVDLIEILLHKKALIDPGFIIKHEWFKSKRKIEEKFPFDFSGKKEIFTIMQQIQQKRDILCYGPPQDPATIASIITDFQKLKELCIKEESYEL